jgi:hypothetical protein
MLAIAGQLAVYFDLFEGTEQLYDQHLIEHYSASEMLDSGTNKRH